MSDGAESQVAGLSILVQLSRRVREAASAEEIGFIAVNESRQLLPYRQSALWIRGKGVLPFQAFRNRIAVRRMCNG